MFNFKVFRGLKSYLFRNVTDLIMFSLTSSYFGVLNTLSFLRLLNVEVIWLYEITYFNFVREPVFPNLTNKTQLTDRPDFFLAR